MRDEMLNFAQAVGLMDNMLMKHTAVTMGGVRLTHLTLAGAVGCVAERVAQRRYVAPISVFTPNTEQLIQAADNPVFLAILNRATVTVPDSVGVTLADWWRAFISGGPWRVRERVAGVDMAESLLSEAAVRGWKVALIGGIGNASEIAIDNLKKRFKGLSIWCVPVGPVVMNSKNLDITMENEVDVTRRINEIRPDILLVGLGAPKQEAWVMKYGGKLQVQAVMAVGGAIDMWSGYQVRAPRLMRQWGFEWLWRLGRQPWRIGRQMRLVRFGWRVVMGKI